MSLLSFLGFTDNSEKVQELIGKKATIIDVRTPAEFSSGHINGSVNIPLNAIQAHLPNLKEAGNPIITVCRSGARSGQAASFLGQNGIECENGGPWNSLQAQL